MPDMIFESLIARRAFSVKDSEKGPLMLRGLRDLVDHHYASCPPYRNMIDAVHGRNLSIARLDAVPYLPAALFKRMVLASTANPTLTLQSSGTTGQQPSRIVVDLETSSRQSRGLVSTFRPILGDKRIPLLVIDTRGVITDSRVLTARGAGVLGMMKFGAKATFALDAELNLDESVVVNFVDRHKGAPFLIFGFTFLVWVKLLKALEHSNIDMSNGILVHSGGWKKMEELQVPNHVFRERLRKAFGLEHIYNFYGFVEQLGSVFLEAEDGLLYAPNYADVIVRRPGTFEPAAIGETGLLQVVSLLPKSYPGHSVLTEDLGVIERVDHPEIGRMGKGIRIVGRLPAAELRGCSDVVAAAA
jgi:phenylacetate-coenzyme A ligase PaaK-like adenylate-forming protein